MKTTNAGNIEKGSYIIYRGEPHFVVKTEFMNPGKGSAIMRVKMRNIKSKAMADYTYKSQESVEVADVDKKEMQYLYHDENVAYFMDPKTYDQAEVPIALVAEQIGLLKAETMCWTVWYIDEAVGVILPPHVQLLVTEADEGVAGNTVNAPKKQATVETGLTVHVPLFVKEGDLIEIDTSSGEYVSRVNK